MKRWLNTSMLLAVLPFGCTFSWPAASAAETYTPHLAVNPTGAGETNRITNAVEDAEAAEIRRLMASARDRAGRITNGYRCAWEALLLAPRSQQIQFMDIRATITEALSFIGNRESLPVLELAFGPTCEPGVEAGQGSPAAARQREIIYAFSRFPGEASLQAILRSLAMAEASSTKPLPKFGGQTLREITVRFLSHQNDPAKEAQWQQVLRKFPKDHLPADQRELLERVTSP